MKKFFNNYIYIFITLLFIVLIFKYNIIFQNCIINGTTIFFKNVFPTIFPMLIINDILINYNFINILNKLFHNFFYKIFKFSKQATYVFLMSIISGTPTNGFIVNNLVKNNKLNNHDASIILTYSFFLNPLFLYNMLFKIFNNKFISLRLILTSYLTNFIIALFMRKKYTDNLSINNYDNPKSFSIVLKSSIERSFSILINILGTIIFYLVLSEGINIFIKNTYLNCLINGLLEVTGGLHKLNLLNINLKLKEIIAINFISFGGLSIHSQIKSIISDTSINKKPFVISRIISALISTLATIILS